MNDSDTNTPEVRVRNEGRDWRVRLDTRGRQEVGDVEMLKEGTSEGHTGSGSACAGGRSCGWSFSGTWALFWFGSRGNGPNLSNDGGDIYDTRPVTEQRAVLRYKNEREE